jgi:hypothetical protein
MIIQVIIKFINILSLKTIITTFIFMGLAMALQEVYLFADGNNTIYSFLDSAIVKDNNKYCVLLALGLTIVFNMYISPTKTNLKINFNIVNIERRKKKKVDEEEEEMAKYKKKHCCCSFEGFIKHKCSLCTCITVIVISLAVATIISITTMTLIWK